MMRVALFTLTGVLFLGHWLLADPSFERATDTKYVLLFSAALLTLALALAVFGRMLGGRWVLRFSLLAGAGAALGSISNLVEDGFDIGWAFWAFILSLLIIDPALVALSVVIALTARGAYRLLALTPAATLVSVVLYVYVGGPLMLAAWLAAAAVVLVLPTRTTSPRRIRHLSEARGPRRRRSGAQSP